MTEKNKTRILVECAVLIAMGTILAQIKLFRMPSGGSVTALSMVPFIIIAFRHGTRWGLIAGLANGLLQMALGGIYTPPAGTFLSLLGSILLDYILAYWCLGLADVLAGGKAKRSVKTVCLGTAAVCFLRFVCAFLSGFLIWSSLTDGVWSAFVYSLTYNGAYLLPESLLTVAAMGLLYKKYPAILG